MIFARNLYCNRKNICLKIRTASIVTNRTVWATRKSWLFSSCFIPAVSDASSIIIWNMSVNIWRDCFPNACLITVLWNWKRACYFPLTIFIKNVLLGTCTGISLVDSTSLRVCRNQRILIHKTFGGLRCVRNALWAGSSDSSRTWLSMTGGESSISCSFPGMWMTGTP